MKKKIINFLICSLMLIGTGIVISLIYINSTKIEYPRYFEKLNISNVRIYGEMEEVNIAIIDSGFDESCQKYFNKEVIRYNVTGENILYDSTGHGTQMALLMASNSNKKNSIYGINPNI